MLLPYRTIRETTIVGADSRELEQTIKRISRARLPSDTVELARALLGKVLVRRFTGGMAAGRIVETEAYLQHDPACHAFRGVTPRNRSLFLEHGHAYVYLCYGTSYLLNVSSEPCGIGSGVLLRALEPLHGTEHMQRNARHVKLTDLTRGPGRLTTALRVNLMHDGLNLFTDKQLWIGSDGHKVKAIGESVRIGLTKAAEERLRFYVAGSRYLSGPRRLNDQA
ncbi:MAG TPA: DNA-3-methyladenine glycosylase [Steroidobacteraceae bacterium]|jgi:DNA-3-methyladenine glycosylase|nr:DNA-3-methyladenine glycosylase [Steroidobacteraceae bacterium]